MMRSSILGLLLAGAFACGTPAMAQNRPPAGAPGKAAEVAPAPTTLEGLFERLKTARDAAEGRVIAKQIEQRWLRGPNETATLLMERVGQAMAANAHETAIELIDSILLLHPAWAEAYNKRATILFLMDDYDGSLRDIRLTLAHEPRHFGALAGLGMIFQRMGRSKAAYSAYKRALDIHPHLGELRSITDRMKPEIEGQEL